MPSVRFWAPIVVVVAVAMVLGGCTTNFKSGPGGLSGDIGPLPGDLPANPDPCATYCKEWVPPVYRKVPRLRQTAGGRMQTTEYTVMRTDFEDVQVRGRERVTRVGCGKTCEESLVMVQPGGYRWTQTPGGCWKYEHCEPQYKWCNRVEEEEGFTYCAERPPEYETVAYSHPVTKTRNEYVEPTYEIVYDEELYVPGHWRWKASYDCECQPQTDRCNCRPGRLFSVEKKCKQDCVTDSCARSN